MRNRLFILFILTAVTAQAGGWLQPKGKGYYKLSEYWIVFDKHYTDAGLLDPNVTTGLFNTVLYAEHGLSDRFTGVVNATLFSRNYTNNLVSSRTDNVIAQGDVINSVGDIDLGLKYGVTGPESKFALSLTALLGVPTGRTEGGLQGNLATGDGEFNQLLQIDLGKGWKASDLFSLYGNAYVGLNNRTNEFSDEFRFGLESGVGVFKDRLWLAGKYTVVDSFKNGKTAATSTTSSVFANNTEFNSLGVEASVYVTKRLGVSFAYATATRGELIAAAPSYSIGVYLDTTK